MKEKTSQILFNYWNEVRGRRIAPRRFEIEPSRIASILPETFILEREARHQHRFRLAGTRVCEHFGREFRGVNILDLFTETDREPVDRVLETVTAEGAVGVINLDGVEKQGRKVMLELLLLPLVHTGESVTRILGSIATSYPATWLGHHPIDRITVRQFNVLWPDGRPHADIKLLDKPSPFARPQSKSRPPAVTRRTFRGYEGGLSKPNTQES